MLNRRHSGKSKKSRNKRTTIKFGVNDQFEFLYFPCQCSNEFFVNCDLAVLQPTLGNFRGDSFTHAISITTFCFAFFDPKFNGNMVTRLGHYLIPILHNLLS